MNCSTSSKGSGGWTYNTFILEPNRSASCLHSRNEQTNTRGQTIRKPHFRRMAWKRAKMTVQSLPPLNAKHISSSLREEGLKVNVKKVGDPTTGNSEVPFQWHTQRHVVWGRDLQREGWACQTGSLWSAMTALPSPSPPHHPLGWGSGSWQRRSYLYVCLFMEKRVCYE